MPDGTVYAGTSPDTHKPMYTTPADARPPATPWEKEEAESCGAPNRVTWQTAIDHAAKLDAHGHRDWRVPTKGELNTLFNNRAAIGGFDESGDGQCSWYWSSLRSDDIAWGQQFSDGKQCPNGRHIIASLRLVR